MNRRLILYWYVPKNRWHPLYDLHLSNLKEYSDRFSGTDLIVSRDQDTPEEYLQETVSRLQDILPNVSLTFWQNDPNKREGDYFYKEVIGKLDRFDPDTAYFFTHNKGAYSNYMSDRGVRDWINFMYFANLYDIDRIKTYLEQSETISIGTFTVRGIPRDWEYMKYSWHYSGTFFWLIPIRLQKHLEQTNQVDYLPPNGRYFAESYLGSVIPYNSGKDIHLYGELESCLHIENFIKTRIPEKDRQNYYQVTGKFL